MTLLDYLDAISIAGSRFKANEDAMGRAWNRAWVIDGLADIAEPVMASSSGGAWLSRRVNYFFARHAHIADTQEMMANVACDLEQTFVQERCRTLQERWESPFAAFVMMTMLRGGEIEVAWLGTSRAILHGSDNSVHSFGATPSSEEQESQAIVKFKAQDPSARYRSDEAQEFLRARRALYNLPGQQGMLAPDKAFAPLVKRSKVKLKRPADALLMTIGFAALELRYLDIAEPAFVHSAVEHGLARLVARLRKIEEDMDPDCNHFPRWRKSEDATAMLVTLP
ncbi:hypothetical protein [Terrarubrum flagellatum]|uniref:hypothetical protein n=1 Tax=Terrirubrum flagellatum TaxID=2895980 RepID=UPI00314538AF